MVYETNGFWEERNKHELASGQPPVDWLCSYATLQPLIEPILERPRCSALIVGSGTARFPEEIYDSGVREVVMLDASQAAVTAVSDRNADGGRRGLRCVHADVGQAALAIPGTGAAPPVFDVVVDKGTVDCILAGRDGFGRARAAISNMYHALKTPGTLVLISHSCPSERLDLLQSVYWHEMKVKQVQSTPWEQLASEEEYEERLVDWEAGPAQPYVPGAAWVYVLEK